MGIFQNNLMGAAAAASAGGGDFYTHQIAQSVRMPAPSSTGSSNSRLTRTVGTVDSNVHWTLNFWIKRSAIEGTNPVSTARPLDVFTPRSGTSGSVLQEFQFGATGSYGAGDAFVITNTNTGAYVLSTDNLFRDTSAWYNIHIQADLDNGTAGEKLKIFVNGTEASYNVDNRSSYTSLAGMVAGAWTIGDYYGYGYPIQSYFAQWCYIDGTTYAASDFGETKNGVWIPKDPSGLTFGSEGFYLDFASSGDLGNDVSGNNNDWTATNIAAHDQMLDSPTFGGSNGGNFATLGPLWNTPSSVTLSEGNLTVATTANNVGCMSNWAVPEGGKWYWEVMFSNQYSSGTPMYNGIAYGDVSLTTSETANQISYYSYQGNKFIGTSSTSYGAAYAENDIIGVAVDKVNNTIQFYKNGSGQGAFDISSFTSKDLFPYSAVTGVIGLQGFSYNFGADGTFAGLITAGGNADTTGYGNFKYAPPTDFLAMCSGNLPVADAIDPAQTDDDFPQKLFSTKLYTGNGGTNAINGVGFAPDWTWIKERGDANAHKLTDSTRGVTKALVIDTNAAETTDSNGLTAFGADGFTLGSDAIYNNSSDTYASWNWRLNGGTEVSNGTGGIASTVQVDPSGGFSLVKYSGTRSASTVGHGLSSAPTWIFAKQYGATVGWVIYTTAMGGSYYMTIDAGGQGADAGVWNNTNSTSSVFSVGSGGSANGGSMLAYCWANVEGYIKSGSYEGNNNVDGTFVYCGFRPAFIICKSIDSGTSWQLFDDKRLGYNVDNNSFLVDTDVAEATTDMIDILSNGFKLKIATDPNLAETYIYLAIAENPFKYATAR